MQQAFVWEIKGQVFIGISPSADLDLRALETAMGSRASRKFSLPESRALQQYLKQWKHSVPKRFRFCIHESYAIGKEFLLCNSIKYAPRITPYR